MEGGMVLWSGQHMVIHMFCQPSSCCEPERSMVVVEHGIWRLHWNGADGA